MNPDDYRAFICGACGLITSGETAGPRAVKLICTHCTSNTLKPLFSPSAELAAKKYGLDIVGLRQSWNQEVGALIANHHQRRAASIKRTQRIISFCFGVWAWSVAMVFYPTFVTTLTVLIAIAVIVWRIKKTN